MPKRTVWLTTGVVVGVASTLWAERKIRRSVQEATARLQPDALVMEVGRSARQAAGSAGGRVRDAVSSGRQEMRRRERELWAELSVTDGEENRPEPPPTDSLMSTSGSGGSGEGRRRRRVRSVREDLVS
jgi:hypothetical protein